MSDTRTAVLDAAAELFDARGYAAVSIGDLTAASGVSNGSIYHHFGAKDGVLPPSAAEELHRCLKDSKLIMVEGARHSLFFTHSQQVNSAVAEFLASHSLR